MLPQPPNPRRRVERVAFTACAGLVVLFGVLSYSASLRKSATFDEPFHAVAGWIKLRMNDFRMDSESLPLATGWSAILNGGDSIRFDPENENWTKLVDNPYRGFDLATNLLYRTRGNDGEAFINRGRFMMMLFGVGMAALIARWSWKVGGPLAGVIGAGLFCLDPNMLGHGSLVKTDIAVAFAMAGAIYMVWLVGQRMTVGNAVILALVMGAAMNVKFSSVLLWPLATILLGIRALGRSEWNVMGRVLTRVGPKLLAAAGLVMFAGVVTVIVTWALHGFRFGPSVDSSIVLRPDSYRYEIIQHRYRQEHPGVGAGARSDEPRLARIDRLIEMIEIAQRELDASAEATEIRVRLQGFIDRARTVRQDSPPDERALDIAEYQLAFVRFFAQQPPDAPDRFTRFGEFLLRYRLMPSAWTHGLMVQYSRSKILDSYLLGEVRHTGNWYFFPVAILVKTPVAEVIALVSAAIFGIWLIRSRWPERVRWGWAAMCILVPPMAFLAMAMAANLNIGLRHVFPMYPFMFVAAGVAIAAAIERGGMVVRRVTVVFGVILLAETVLAWPNYVAHFNVVARATVGELFLLGDSNLDWGQDLPALRDWQRANLRRPQLALAYFGMAAPEFYGIDFIPLPPWPPPPELLHTHVLAVSATYLQGITDPRYTGYRQLTPGEVLGGTIYLYYDRPTAR